MTATRRDVVIGLTGLVAASAGAGAMPTLAPQRESPRRWLLDEALEYRCEAGDAIVLGRGHFIDLAFFERLPPAKYIASLGAANELLLLDMLRDARIGSGTRPAGGILFDIPETGP